MFGEPCRCGTLNPAGCLFEYRAGTPNPAECLTCRLSGGDRVVPFRRPTAEENAAWSLCWLSVRPDGTKPKPWSLVSHDDLLFIPGTVRHLNDQSGILVQWNPDELPSPFRSAKPLFRRFPPGVLAVIERAR